MPTPPLPARDGMPPWLAHAVRVWVQRHLPQPPTPAAPLAVALSGGADSVVLLSAAARCWPGAVVALHVNHGLQAAAADFEHSCSRLCQAWGVPLQVVRVQVPFAPGDSVEAEARRARYHALADMAGQVSAQAVWLAQHADDQAETVLLALSRGAGLPGLSAMASASTKQGVLFGRPLLAIRSRALRDWAVSWQAPFVDDPTNQDLRFTRNRLRHETLPALERQFPSIVTTLARTARHAAEATELLRELAQADAARVGLPPSIQGLQALSAPRRANVLRHWLQTCTGSAPSTAQLDELAHQVVACTTRGHAISLKVGRGWVEREGAGLRFVPSAARHTALPGRLSRGEGDQL